MTRKLEGLMELQHLANQCSHHMSVICSKACLFAFCSGGKEGWGEGGGGEEVSFWSSQSHNTWQE